MKKLLLSLFMLTILGLSVNADNFISSAKTNCTTPSNPTSVTASPSAVMACASVSLNATSASSTSIEWFTVSTGGTSIGSSLSGANFVVHPYGTITYWAESENGSCSSLSRTPVAVIVTGGGIIFTAQPDTTPQTYCVGASSLPLTANVTGATAYQWYSNTVPSNTGGTLIAGATTNTYYPPTTTADTLYYYCVITTSGCYPLSNVSGEIIVKVCTGINEINSENNFIVLPNPANNNLTVITSGIKQTVFSIYGIRGELLMKQVLQKEETTIDISMLAKGMYFVKVKTEKGVAVKKFIKE